jgi:hypothetical protein
LVTSRRRYCWNYSGCWFNRRRFKWICFTLDVDFGTVSSIAYVDNGTASLWAAIESNNELSEILSNGNETLGNDMIVSDTDYILFGSDNITTGHNISGASGGTFFIQSPENIEVNSDKNISIKSGTSSGNDGISLFGGGATDYSLGFAYIGGPTSDNTQIGYGSDAYMTFRDNGSPGNERVSIYVSGVQVMAFDDTGNTLRTASGDTTVDNDTTDGLLKYSVDPTTTTTWTDRSIPDKSYVDSQVIGLTTKTSDVRTFFIGVVETITHTLNTEDLIIQTYDSTGVQIIPDTIQITGTSSVDITLSQTLSSVKTIIIG